MTVYTMIKICMFALFILSARCKFPVQRKYNITEDAASILHSLYTVSGPKEDVIMSVFATKTNDQIQDIKAEYKRITSTQDLSKDCYALLQGDFSTLIHDMLIPRSEFYAHKLYNAMLGLGTDERTITEILCPMNRTEILEVSSIYENLYGSTLRADVLSETSGTYQHLLVSLCDALRPDDDTEINLTAAAADVITLNDSYVEKWGALMEMDYVNIFATRSYRQLKVIFDKFENDMKRDIRSILKERVYDNVFYGLDCIAEIVYSKASYFADQFEVSMLGIGTDDHQLCRLVVGRSEIDLPEIRKAYAKIYKMTLVDRIRDDTQGNYMKLLCTLVER